jgi:hypothetical protein
LRSGRARARAEKVTATKKGVAEKAAPAKMGAAAPRSQKAAGARRA